MHGAVFPAKDLQSRKENSRQLPVTLSADATAPCISFPFSPLRPRLPLVV